MKKVFPILIVAGIVSMGLTDRHVLDVKLKGGEVLMEDNYEKYDTLWKKFDSLSSREGLVQSARGVADTLYSIAKQDHNTSEMVRALISMLHIDATREEDAYVKAIQRIQHELRDAREPVSSVLNILLAEHYWQYYQHNRWKFYDRTQSVNYSDDDIRTWDLPTLFEKCLQTYLQALSNREVLKKYPLSAYGRLVHNAGGTGEKYHPTLFDLIAHRAIEFLMSEEPEITRPAYTFELDSEKYFSPATEFASVEIATRDTLSMKYHALLLFQELIDFHKNDREPFALVDVDLKRLDFVNSFSVIQNKDSLYTGALETLRKKHSNNEVCAEITYYIAQHYASAAATFTTNRAEENRWLYKKANDLCNEMVSRFPESYGAAMCRSLLASITEKRLDISNGLVVLPRRPFKLVAKYRNVNTLHWRLIPVSVDEYNKIINHSSHSYEEIHSELASMRFTHSERVLLPDPGDFQEHTVEVMLPIIPTGFYIVLASWNEAFQVSENIMNHSTVRCSQISYFSKSRQNGTGGHEYFVRDRESGAPFEGVKADVLIQEFNNLKRNYIEKLYGTYQTDKNGWFLIPEPKREQQYADYRTRFYKGKDELYSDRNYLYRSGGNGKYDRTKTFFFTDRSIYRPGQTIYYKGIQIHSNRDSSRVIAGAGGTVSFYDANGQVISSHTYATNEYGTFNGTFTAPTGVLNGSMTLRNETGSAYIRVEEYKRPKFEVSFMPVEGSYRCNDDITVKGSAKTFSGAPVSGSQVKYRVSRQSIFPFWWCWWCPRPMSPSMEIAHGTVDTDDTGGYTCTFKAIPDLSVKKSDNPQFIYTLNASVTDINGETHEASTSVTVAYTSVNLMVNIAQRVSRQSGEHFTISSKNNNGVDIPLKGTIEIYRLETPSKIIRNRLDQSVQIDTTIMSREDHDTFFPTDLYRNENDWSTWKLKNQVYRNTFNTSEEQGLRIGNLKKWETGAYVMKAHSTDTHGQDVDVIRYFTLYDEKENSLPYATADWFEPLTEKVEPGERARFLVGSSYTGVMVLWETEHNGNITHSEWITLNNSQRVLEIPIEEKHRGNLSVHYTFIRDNRFFTHNEIVQVPWTNKELTVEFETFRDKLQPGEAEEWRLKIRGPKQEMVASEMAISLYDASLDAFTSHGWNFPIYPYKSFLIGWSARDCFGVANGTGINLANHYPGMPQREYPVLYWGRYDFHYATDYFQGYRYGGGMVKSSVPLSAMAKRSAKDMVAAPAPSSSPELMNLAESFDGVQKGMGGIAERTEEPKGQQDAAGASHELNVKARTNLNETAFFYPELRTDKDGSLIVKFTIPEALTRWKMLGFAHTKDLKFTLSTRELVTQKELMVEPNMPRFFREHDTIDLSAKLVNLSDSDLSGTARLLVFDAATMKPVDSLFENANATKPFTVKKGLNTALTWRMVIPEGAGPVHCRVVAKAGAFSDGEEKIVPVLTDRMLVTESLPLPIRKKGTKQFSFDKLKQQNNNSTTLRHHKLTLEFTSNPVWYAVQAIPYMMEYTYECAEQTFARYYGNSIGAYIVNSNPRIKAVFDTWKVKNPDGFISALEKNQELKSLLLEETPWLIDAKDEGENKKRIGLLFDLNTMRNQLDRSLDRLKKMQLGNGGWPWFDGMPDNRYITRHIVSGFGKLDNLKIIDCRTDEELYDMLKRAVEYCDHELRKDYDWILKSGKIDADNLGYEAIHHLYMRSFFTDIKWSKKDKEAFDYFIKQSERHWLNKSIYMQGLIACALNRFEKNEIPMKIYRSLKEKSLSSDEMGMYWKSMYEDEGWYWYQAPIETQALLIEMFDEVGYDSNSVEAMKVWLLKSKQTQNWKTTKATTDAVYALLLRGADALSVDQSTIIKIGSEVIDLSKAGAANVEAGTGYYKNSWDGENIKPQMGEIKVTRAHDGVAWGSVYWQYFERLDKITSHVTPLSLKRRLFRQIHTDKGIKLEALDKNNTVKIGDKITVRIELSVDRDMEYVHMKDMRSSGFEPVNVLSGYRYQDGLGYYESTRDASTNFFFSYLRKGTYVFEYPLYATHSGEFSNGVTSIQCMYAPEFTSHSEGIRVRIEK